MMQRQLEAPALLQVFLSPRQSRPRFDQHCELMMVRVRRASLLAVVELLCRVSKPGVVCRVVALLLPGCTPLARRRIEVQNIDSQAPLISRSSQPESWGRALCFYGTFHYSCGSVDVNEVQKNLT
jgi:hypothetical protein